MAGTLEDNGRPEAGAVYGRLDMPWATLVALIASAMCKRASLKPSNAQGIIQGDAPMIAIVLRLLDMIAAPVSQRIGVAALRISVAAVFLWIGALKFVPYEADSITPFVANSPVMYFFYKHPEDYKAHLTREGELKPAERAWQTANGTYAFSNGLGTVEMIIGFLVLAGLVSVRLGLAGAVLAFLTPFVTLSFLVTTPEAWVPALGDAQHGFPWLSGAGRLVLKDTVILAGGWLLVVDGARSMLTQLGRRPEAEGANWRRPVSYDASRRAADRASLLTRSSGERRSRTL